MNGHRSKFSFKVNKKTGKKEYEQSALALHCVLYHISDFNMHHFKLGVVKRVRAVDLDREENKLIFKYRTNIRGLNRMMVVR